MYPRYPVPWKNLLSLLASTGRGVRRSFRQDAVRCLAQARLPMQVGGSEYIPLQGPALITTNHYSRPGFRAWWIALAISNLVPVEIHWTMTAAWTPAKSLSSYLLASLSQRLFPRIARVYGFTAMPPMPPRSWETTARALAARRVLAIARSQPPPVIALAPEGQDTPGGALMRPHPGAGRLIQLLSGLGYVIHPLGVYEDRGALCLSFGTPRCLELPAGLTRREADWQASQFVMEAIACQLPMRLRGEFTLGSSGTD